MARWIVETNFFVEAETDEDAEERIRQMLSEGKVSEAWTIAWVSEDDR